MARIPYPPQLNTRALRWDSLEHGNRVGSVFVRMDDEYREGKTFFANFGHGCIKVPVLDLEVLWNLARNAIPGKFQLELFAELGVSFKTTNCIESLMAILSRYTDKVDRWRNSLQKHRWLSTALLEIEPRLRKVKGYKKLSKLREALRREATLLREAA